ncbi:MAG: hypothetical protein WCG87_06755 [Bacteroidota bacterium]
MKKIAYCILFLSLTVQDFCNAQMKPNWFFHDELVNDIENSKDTVYIFDRTKLERLNSIKQLDNAAEISCKTKNGDSINLLITSSQFNSSKHKVHLADTVYKFIHNRKEVDYLIEKNIIDGKKFYGFYGEVRRIEISKLKIKWGRNWLIVPRRAYSNLFEPHFSSLEAYLSENKKLLFIYLHGADGADSYSVKFVFNEKQYLTRLITTIECVDGYDFLDAKVDICE